MSTHPIDRYLARCPRCVTFIYGAVAFAMLDTGFRNGKRVRKAAVVTDQKLWLVEIKNGAPVLTNESRVLGPTPQDITGITSGDFNGDGVPDLAIAQQGGIRVILQKPVNE